MARLTGKIKWYDIKKGYGYISGDDGNDYFVHFSDFEKARTYVGAEPRDTVSFELYETERGPQAGKVQITNFTSIKSRVKHLKLKKAEDKS